MNRFFILLGLALLLSGCVSKESMLYLDAQSELRACQASRATIEQELWKCWNTLDSSSSKPDRINVDQIQLKEQPSSSSLNVESARPGKLTIHSPETGALIIGDHAMVIQFDGKVFWKRNGQVARAVTDEQLTAAFYRAIMSIDAYCASRNYPLKP